jgi:hypothetical protein
VRPRLYIVRDDQVHRAKPVDELRYVRRRLAQGASWRTVLRELALLGRR